MTSRTTARALCLAALLTGATTVAAQRGPAASATKISGEQFALACAPKLAFDTPDAPLRVTGGQDSFARLTYAPGDLITINAGTRNGIQVGQEYYTRRVKMSQREAVTRETPATVVTSGWIRVYAVDDTMSLATITHACDSVEVGDHLEPFALPAMPAISADKPKPVRENYGLVMTGSDRRRVFARGDFFAINHGTDHGVAPGAQFVLYRNTKRADNFLYDLGEAVAVEVNKETSTLLVTVSRDAIQAGDLVAIRPPATAP